MKMLLAGLDAETMNASTTGATISDGIIDRLCSNASFGLVCMPFEEHERIWFLTTEVALTAVIALLGICGRYPTLDTGCLAVSESNRLSSNPISSKTPLFGGDNYT